MADRSSITISNFLPLTTTQNKMSLEVGRLIKNENYLYLTSGGLEERGGGDDLVAGPASALAYGFTNYKTNEGTEFLLIVQGTKIYYYNSTAWIDTGVTVTTGLYTRFEQAGYGVNRNTYGVNGTDSVIKITTTANVPSGSTVASSPTDGHHIRLHKNRLFIANDRDTLYFTDVNAFETWAIGTNDIQIAPGVDGYIKGLELWGDSLFIFKEFGIYIIPNAADAVADWKVLKTDASNGTQSPDTIRRTKDGIYYLSLDAKVRRINPNITFTSGEYVLGGTGTPVVSEKIQEDISTNIERSNIDRAHAILFNDLYILLYNSINADGNENDVCYVADTSKFEKNDNSTSLQPYWTKFTNFEFDFFAIQTVSDYPRLYCVNILGKTVERLNVNIHNDSTESIKSIAEIGWLAPYDRNGNIDSSTYRIFHPIIIFAELEYWNMEIEIATYKFGDFISEEITGNSYILYPAFPTSVVVGTAIVGTATITNFGIKSDKFRTGLRGNFIAFRLQNLNADEFTRINKIIIFYENLHKE